MTEWDIEEYVTISSQKALFGISVFILYEEEIHVTYRLILSEQWLYRMTEPYFQMIKKVFLFSAPMMHRIINMNIEQWLSRSCQNGRYDILLSVRCHTRTSYTCSTVNAKCSYDKTTPSRGRLHETLPAAVPRSGWLDTHYIERLFSRTALAFPSSAESFRHRLRTKWL